MIRFRLAEILKQRHMSAYRLAAETGLTKPVTYRLARVGGGGLHRLDLDTLEAICRVLRVQPGELLEYVADTEEATSRHGRPGRQA